MSRAINIVAPFRPFEPESDLHKSLPDFDWIAALRMMAHTASISCRSDVRALTDVDTELPIDAFKYTTTKRRLMLWTLEVCACYLASRDCDHDTVMLDVDQLVFGDLRPFFTPGVDLGVLVRADAKHAETDGGQPLLNGVQFWRKGSRKKLAAFYRRALQLAEALPDERIRWGADTDALRMLIEPIELGVVERAGLRVQMIDARDVLESFSDNHKQLIDSNVTPWPKRAVLDFRFQRKPFMPILYQRAIAAGVVR